MGTVSAVAGRVAAPRIGDVEELERVILPPFVEVRALYKPFPVVVYAAGVLDEDKLAVYVNDSLGRLLAEEVEGVELLGSRGGSYVYRVDVRLARGFFKPGGAVFILAYGGVGEEYNLTILGPYKRSPVEYEARVEDSRVVVRAVNPSDEALTVGIAYVANCGPGQAPAANVTLGPGGSSVFTVRLPGGCSAPLTLVVVLRGAGGELFYDYVPVG